jgi:hypothetical protein
MILGWNLHYKLYSCMISVLEVNTTLDMKEENKTNLKVGYKGRLHNELKFTTDAIIIY